MRHPTQCNYNGVLQFTLLHLNYTTPNDDNWRIKNWKGFGRKQSWPKLLTWSFPGGIEENHGNPL
jgi:hypothetical protein